MELIRILLSSFLISIMAGSLAFLIVRVWHHIKEGVARRNREKEAIAEKEHRDWFNSYTLLQGEMMKLNWELNKPKEMTASIFQINKKITCNVLDCQGTATFKWFYQFDENQKLNRVGNNGNIIGWLGWGTYICEVTCGEKTITVSNTFSKTAGESRVNTLSLPVKEKRVNVTGPAWDYGKIPESRREEIARLVKEEKWKDLVLIHNSLQLSTNTYCCDLTEVKNNFTKYVEMPGTGSEVVANS